MANIKSAKKRAKQEIKRREKNLNRKTAIKTAIRSVEDALKAGESKEATVELLKKAEAQLARAKGKGVLHKNNSARKISNLAKKVAAAHKEKKKAAPKAKAKAE